VKYELLIRGRAKRDVRRAAKWYERQHEGLGKEFVVEVDAALERIAGNPEQYEVVHREIRHCILRRFPYGVLYRIQANKISVFAVIHLKRDEVLWKA
jgi:plasmid stabilization system protein ParE